MTENNPSLKFTHAEHEQALEWHTRRGIQALWRTEGSRIHIADVLRDRRGYFRVLDNCDEAYSAYRNAVCAFAGEEYDYDADRTLAEEDAVDHLLSTPDEIPRAADFVTSLFNNTLLIATECSSDQLQEDISESEVLRDHAYTMVGGATMAVDTLDTIGHYHQEVDMDEVSLPSRTAQW